jgi:hypothetical protein
MSWNVDDAQPNVIQQQLGKSQFNRDTASFLLGQSIRIHSGQRPDQSRLAVIDMTRGAEYHGGVRCEL